jgi:hypothetical protein
LEPARASSPDQDRVDRLFPQHGDLRIERTGPCGLQPARHQYALYRSLAFTSLAFTAEKPLLLDFDNGSHRAANRKDVVRVSLGRRVRHHGRGPGAVQDGRVDTAGRALDAITVDIIRANPKHGRGGALTLQGYGELKTRFGSFLKLLNSFGKDVVLIAHMDEQRNGDELVERLDVQGGSKGEIYKAADAMGRLPSSTASAGCASLRPTPRSARTPASLNR